MMRKVEKQSDDCSEFSTHASRYYFIGGCAFVAKHCYWQRSSYIFGPCHSLVSLSCSSKVKSWNYDITSTSCPIGSLSNPNPPDLI